MDKSINRQIDQNKQTNRSNKQTNKKLINKLLDDKLHFKHNVTPKVKPRYTSEQIKDVWTQYWLILIMLKQGQPNRFLYTHFLLHIVWARSYDC